eukprot:TRINITY_DN3544_c1_g3_i4.p1 TRINITY_DN3544_c1_g3~~TRINITY_DN3544_c1_g3_i4.p1  ORF type:complete len:408 (-),score=71.70 TRINITY_DN3544_c1_g3_i4:48-1238(-)
MYRFNKVTNNRKMRVVRFSKYHHLYTVLCALAICIPSIIIRIISNMSHIEGDESLFEKSYILQDKDPQFTFTLSQPVYDLYNDYTLVTLLVISFNQFYSFALALFVGFLSKMARSDQVKKTNIALAKEMLTLERGSFICAFVFLAELIYCLMNQAFDMASNSKISHIGFENGNCSATLDGVRTLTLIQMLVSGCCFLSFMWIIFTARVKKILIHMICMLRYSRTTGNTNGTNTTGKLPTISHVLSDEMIARLKMTNCDTIDNISDRRTSRGDTFQPICDRTSGANSSIDDSMVKMYPSKSNERAASQITTATSKVGTGALVSTQFSFLKRKGSYGQSPLISAVLPKNGSSKVDSFQAAARRPRLSWQGLPKCDKECDLRRIVTSKGIPLTNLPKVR